MKKLLLLFITLYVMIITSCVSTSMPLVDKLNYREDYVSGIDSFFEDKCIIPDTNFIGFVKGKFLLRLTAISSSEAIAYYIDIPSNAAGVDEVAITYKVNINDKSFIKIDRTEADKLVNNSSSKMNIKEITNSKDEIAGIIKSANSIIGAKKGDFFGGRISNVYKFDLASADGGETLECYEVYSTKANSTRTRVDLVYVKNDSKYVIEVHPWSEDTPRNFRVRYNLDDLRLSNNGALLYVSNLAGNSQVINVNSNTVDDVYPEIAFRASISPDWKKLFIYTADGKEFLISALDLR